MCLECYKLNKVMVQNNYPLAPIDDYLDRLAKAMYFSHIDLKSNYCRNPTTHLGPNGGRLGVPQWAHKCQLLRIPSKAKLVSIQTDVIYLVQVASDVVYAKHGVEFHSC